MASADDINSTLQGIVRNISNEAANILTLGTAIVSASGGGNALLVIAINAVASAILSSFPQVGGTFTLANATVTVVTQSQIGVNSKVFFTPTNATGTLTQRTAGLYHSTNTAGSSFSVSTQTGLALGTETFEYLVFGPT